MLDRFNIRIHLAGWPFIFAFLVLTVVAGLIWMPNYVIGGVLTVWCVYFFRDPARVTPVRPGLVVSAADGVIAALAEAPPPPELEMGAKPVWRISTFLNVFDVHVNRAPVDGTVSKMAYTPGKFVNAALDKASEDNERMALRFDREQGPSVAVVLIAGLVARRIRCFTSEGADLARGQRFGLIRFGSRADVYLPVGVEPLVCIGQRVVGGETVLADEASGEGARESEVR